MVPPAIPAIAPADRPLGGLEVVVAPANLVVLRHYGKVPVIDKVLVASLIPNPELPLA